MNYQLMWHTSCTNSSVSSIDRTSPIVCITSAKSGYFMETSFKKLFQCWPAVFTNPFPSLSNTLNASLISSSISESLNSLEQSSLPVQLFLLGHQPDKLIETYVTISILVNDRDHILDWTNRPDSIRESPREKNPVNLGQLTQMWVRGPNIL